MVNKYLEVNLNKMNVFFVPVHGVAQSAKAFNELESKLPSLRSRHFYGVLEGTPDNGVYRACVVKEQNETIEGLESWIIPGGKYVKAKIKNWEKQTDSIAKTFNTMSERYEVDFGRPTIEFYRSQRELLLFLPIK